MITTKRQDGWWITDVPPGVEEMGPYDTRREADEDRRGIERFLKRVDRPGFRMSADRRQPRSRE